KRTAPTLTQNHSKSLSSSSNGYVGTWRTRSKSPSLSTKRLSASVFLHLITAGQFFRDLVLPCNRPDGQTSFSSRLPSQRQTRLATARVAKISACGLDVRIGVTCSTRIHHSFASPASI